MTIGLLAAFGAAVAAADGCARPRGAAPAPVDALRGASAGDTVGIAAQLMAADRAFAEATAARGLEGWVSFFAPEAVALQRMGNPTRGAAAIRARDSLTFANPAVRLTWTPTDAGAFAGGRLRWGPIIAAGGGCRSARLLPPRYRRRMITHARGSSVTLSGRTGELSVKVWAALST